MQIRRSPILIAIGITVTLLVVVIWYSQEGSRKFTGPEETIRLATLKTNLSNLIWIAQEKQYFAEQGLGVEISNHEAGLMALKELLEGKADLATVAAFVVTKNIFSRPDLRVISVLDEHQETKFVGRTDRGINSMSDVRGKRIGMVKSTTAEYFLEISLVLNGIQNYEIETVDLIPSEQVKAIVEGRVDAIVVWNPYASQAKEQLGQNAIILSAQSGQDDYWLLVSTEEKIKKHQTGIERFLTGISKADDLVRTNIMEAKRCAALQLQWGAGEDSWKDNSYKLGLSRPLLLMMEGQMRWLRSKSIIHQDMKMLNYFYFDALEKTQPESIGIAYRKSR